MEVIPLSLRCKSSIFSRNTHSCSTQLHRKLTARALPSNKRFIFKLFSGTKPKPRGARMNGPNDIKLTQDNLFFPLSKSPIAEMRAKGEWIKRVGKCPISGKNINFECPISGIPTHHSEAEWRQDTEHQRKFAWRLHQANEDEHDLRSGRQVTELTNFPLAQDPEFAINFATWDTFLFTRNFNSCDSPRSIRHISKLLTYPITIGSVLHPFSPYQPGGRLTTEGLRSLTALRYTLNVKEKDAALAAQLGDKPIRIINLGARAESMLPRPVWKQGGPLMFPKARFEVHFIGPEVMHQVGSKLTDSLEETLTEDDDPRMVFVTRKKYYHEVHDSGDLSPLDPYTDIFFLPCPGIGHPTTRKDWEPTILRLLETKCAIVITGFSKEDMERDLKAVSEISKNEYDVLITPGENPFMCRKWDYASFNPSRTILQANWGIFAIRGRRYEVKLQN